MKISKYLVSTTMGRALMDPQAETYVKVSPYTYLEKTAEDLKPGDMVLFAKPFATTTLDDVAPHLGKSPRYAKAKDMIYEKNSSGEYIPLLRGMLIKGLAQRGIVSGSNLEGRILKEGGLDFSESEYERMVDTLYDDLTINGRHYRSRQGVRNWLDGTVIAPRIGDWFLLSDVLSRKVNRDLELFQHGTADPKSLYFNYRLYVTIHQGVMRFLRQAKGLPPESKYTEADSHISLSPEYQIVFNHFMQEINANYALSRVIQSSCIDSEREIAIDKEDGRAVYQRVVSSKKIELPRKSFVEVWDDMYILGKYLEAVCEDYSSEIGGLRDIEPCDISVDAIPRLLEYFQEPLDPLAKINKSWDASYVEHLGEILNALLSGDMDSFFNFERGTSMRLLESYFRTRTAIPNRIFRHLATVAEFNIKRIKDDRLRKSKGRELRKKSDEIFQRYGLRIEEFQPNADDSGQIVCDIGTRMHGFIFFSHAMGGYDSVGTRQFLDSIVEDHSFFQEKVKEVRTSLKGSSLLTKRQTKNVLASYGLSQINDLRKQDFYYERLLITGHQSDGITTKMSPGHKLMKTGEFARLLRTRNITD